MQDYPLFSVVILNYNGKGIVEPCLASVLKSNYPNFEVILVDNASSDDSIDEIERLFEFDNRLKVIRNKANLFYAEGNNIGINNARGEYIFILNSDTEIDNNCLREISVMIEEEDIGAAQPKILIYGKERTIDNMGGVIDRNGYTVGRGSQEKDTGQYSYPDEIFYAGGTAMVIKKKVLDRVGLFDSKFVVHCEDVDLSWRIRLAGYKIILVPKAVVYHKVSRTIIKFGDKNKISFHIRKNRISELIKNYGFLQLCVNLPVSILFYILIFFKEMLIDRDFKLAFTSLSALFWNIKALPYLLEKRRVIQQKIRVLSDKEILKYMYNKSILIEQYFKPFIYGSKN